MAVYEEFKKKKKLNYSLLKRSEIIDMWIKNNSKELLDSYCCSNCRDILSQDIDGNYFCTNGLCFFYERLIERVKGV